MVIYSIYYTKQAVKDSKKILQSGLKSKVMELIDVVTKNPYQNPPPYEKLIGDLAGALSRRINIQHRLVYQVIEAEMAVKIMRMWSHYE